MRATEKHSDECSMAQAVERKNLMNIREKVAQAIDDETFDRFDTFTVINQVVTAFLAAAAEEGWHMRRDEATENMVLQAAKTPGMKAVDGAITIASVHGFKLQPTSWHDSPIADAYRAMLAAAPKFEWDK